MSSIAIAGDFEVIDIVPTINTVAPNQAKYFSVWCSPTRAGPLTASLDVHCDPPRGTCSLALEGAGSIAP